MQRDFDKYPVARVRRRRRGRSLQMPVAPRRAEFGETLHQPRGFPARDSCDRVPATRRDEANDHGTLEQHAHAIHPTEQQPGRGAMNRCQLSEQRDYEVRATVAGVRGNSRLAGRRVVRGTPAAITSAARLFPRQSTTYAADRTIARLILDVL